MDDWQESTHKPSVEMQSLLTSLPIELILEIITFLDVHAVKRLLISSPHLSQLAVIITDLEPRKPLLFFIGFTPPPPRYTIQEFQELENGTTPIRLFELEDVEACAETPNIGNDERTITLMNRLSFVMFNERTYADFRDLEIMPIICATGARVDCQPLSRLSYTNEDGVNLESDLFEEGEILRLYRQTELAPAIGRGVRYLFLCGFTRIEELRMDELKLLTITFLKDHDTRPLIKGLRLPALSQFRIEYNDHFPMFEDIETSSDAIASTCYLPQLELIHMRSIDCKYVLPRIETSIEEIEATDLQWSNEFTSISVVGGPDCILRKLGYSCCEHLYWKRTMHYDYDPVPLFAGANCMMNYITIVNTVPGFRIPEDIGEDSLLLLTLWIENFAPDTEFLNGLFKRRKFRGLENLTVRCHSSPTLTWRERPYLDPVDLSCLVRLESIDIRGCSVYWKPGIQPEITTYAQIPLERLYFKDVWGVQQVAGHYDLEYHPELLIGARQRE